MGWQAAVAPSRQLAPRAAGPTAPTLPRAGLRRAADDAALACMESSQSRHQGRAALPPPRRLLPRARMETAFFHALGGAAEGSYARSDRLDQRRVRMGACAVFMFAS